MPSGFIVLPDGRCLKRQWGAHDVVLRAISDQLTKDKTAKKLRQWLLEQLPGPNDHQELGYGAWHRVADDQFIVRVIDLRRMTALNQWLFCDAVKRAARRVARVDQSEDWLRKCLAELADMVDRYERGEPPLSKSDWRDVIPPEDGMIGPSRETV